MRIDISLPSGGTLAVGHDHAVGLFATVERAGRLEFDRLAHGYDRDRPLDALLQWLVAHGVFNDDDLDEALLAYSDPAYDEEDEPLSTGGQIALKVIEALKKAAAAE